MILTRPRAYDFFGSIVVVKFPRNFKTSEKKKFAEKLMENQNSIKTVLEKTDKVKGRLRRITTKFIAGENTKEVLYRENDCAFRFNIDTTYFSPRLSNERKELSDEVLKKMKNKPLKILVMFAGVAPFSIVLAKKCKKSEVSSVEINREASKYAELNKKLNNLQNLKIIQGDVKKVVPNLKEKFDVILMPRPQLKETFLKQAFQVSKKGTLIYYYDFCKIEDIQSVIEKVNAEAKQNKQKIKILKVKKAGEIAPYKIRIRVDLIVV